MKKSMESTKVLRKRPREFRSVEQAIRELFPADVMRNLDEGRRLVAPEPSDEALQRILAGQ